MCAIAGICDFGSDLRNEFEVVENIVSNMGKSMEHRGPDDFNTMVDEHVAFSHARLSIIDVNNGRQPMTKISTGNSIRMLDNSFYKRKCPLRIMNSFERYSIVYNGEIYNTTELRRELETAGYEFETKSDTEVILNGYIEYGEQVTARLNGIFAFAIWDSKLNRVFLARDRFGVKPLFYTIKDNKLLFASELKGILVHPDIEPVVDREGLCDIFATGPARPSYRAVFKNIKQLMPGQALFFMKDGCSAYHYYKLEAHMHEDDYEITVKRTRELLVDSVRRQLVSDVGACTLLSGGIDSSIVSSIASQLLKEQGKQLSTYSFDYVDNVKYFKADSFVPSMDRPHVDIMKDYIDSNHQYLMCDSKELFDSLFDAVRARDLPGMADVDSSMLYFCRQIKPDYSVCLSGECADEIFGGYPWFVNEQALSSGGFAWSGDLDFRESVLRCDIANEIRIKDYVEQKYAESESQVPVMENDSVAVRQHRKMNYMNIMWFMQTLLERKDRMTMASGLEVRVPFADHRIVEYVYNVPWEYKYHNGVVKGLLRDVAREILPESIRIRKKSPYPKTFNPGYTKLVRNRLTDVVNDNERPIHQIISAKTVKELCVAEKNQNNLSKPWFGQLMAGPQIMAYLIQVDYWLSEYKVKIEL